MCVVLSQVKERESRRNDKLTVSDWSVEADFSLRAAAGWVHVFLRELEELRVPVGA